MIEYIEAATTNPIKCIEYVTQFGTIVNKITNMTPEEWSRIFTSSNDGTDMSTVIY